MNVPVGLLVAHFLGDWFFQFDWMALGKSKDWKALFAHVGVVALFLLPWGWKFALINFVAHLIIDQTTSQWTSKLWFLRLKPRTIPTTGIDIWNFYASDVDLSLRHWFFVAIGFDQLLHFVTFAITFKLLG